MVEYLLYMKEVLDIIPGISISLCLPRGQGRAIHSSSLFVNYSYIFFLVHGTQQVLIDIFFKILFIYF